MAFIDEEIRLYIQKAAPMPSLPYTTRKRHAHNRVEEINHEELEQSLVRSA